MPIKLIIRPIKPGKTEDYKAFVNTLLTCKKNEYHAALKHYNLGKTALFISTIDGRDYAISSHEPGLDSEKLLANWDESTNPFDVWFREQVGNFCDSEVMEDKKIQPKSFGEIIL
jgi:hypothetical protein